MASTFTTVQFMDPPGGPGVTGAVKAGSGIIISNDGTISTQQGGGIVKTITGTNGVTTAGTTDVIVSLNPPTSATIGGVRTVDGSGISIDSQGIIRSIAQFSILAGAGIGVTNVTPISSTVSVLPAGTTAGTRGGVWLDADSGLNVSFTGALSVTPATTTKLGGVKVGSGLSITPDGVLTASGGSGSITGVTAGVGLSGGGTSGAVTLSLLPPTSTVIGGVKAGSNVTIEPDGTLNAQAPAGVNSVSGVSPVVITGTLTNPVVTVQAATTSDPGVVQLYDGVDSTQPSLAATANSVRLAYDAALTRLPLTGGTLTGNITFAGSQTFPGVVSNTSYNAAGTLLVGSGTSTYTALPVGAEGQVLIVNGGAVTWGTQVAAGALPLAGGTMTGDIVFSGTQSFPGVLTTSVAASTYAPLASPGFSGTPTAPTPTPGTNSTILATTAFVTDALSSYTPSGVLSLSGGTMTGTISFATGQTIAGYIANTLLTNTGDIVYASAANTPARLGIGANGNVMSVNAGLPSWRTPAAAGLLTTAAAASTYAPLNSPTLTGPVTVNAGGAAGSNALTVSGGNLVLSTSFTPSSSSDTGSVGEIAWDNSGYLYFCYLPNTWGRVQIDLTPF